MKHILLNDLLATLILAMSALPAFAALKAGDTAPDFQTPASLAGRTFNYHLHDSLMKGAVVVYFYPSAYTGGCDIQAHQFAEDIDKFYAAGVTVIGVSLDSIQRLNDFSADPQYCAGKLPVASDADGKIAKSYDLAVHAAMPGKKDVRGVDIGHGFAERTTFIVMKNGEIAKTIGGLAPADNVRESLAAVQKLAQTK